MKIFDIFKRKKTENVEPKTADDMILTDSGEISSNFSGIQNNVKPTVKIFPWK